MHPAQPVPGLELRLPVRHYDLASTLSSGQAFRWSWQASGWEGVIDGKWVCLQQDSPHSIKATLAEPVTDWSWLEGYLQSRVDLQAILHSFPQDPHLTASTKACSGLRLLRQHPWECLASFILSSNKQIVQIKQIILLLCQRHGNPVPVPPRHLPAWAFPSPAQLAVLSEKDLRNCKMGYRAPGLLQTSRLVSEGTINLEAIRLLPLAQARRELMRCPGVGPKIANCVLLFAYDFPAAFPIDVWVLKALRQLYFPKRRPTPKRLDHFVHTHFGPHAGYAQQYLFHYFRTQDRMESAVRRAGG